MRAKILNNLTKLIVVSMILPLSFSCTKMYEKFNTDQSGATESQMEADNLKTGAYFSQMLRNVILFENGTENFASDYQVAQNLTADIYSGYLAPTGSWYSGAHTGSYVFIEGWREQMFTKSYSRVMSGWMLLSKNATELGTPAVISVANIVKVLAMSRVTDTYGPIPYLGYYSIPMSGAYDSQKDVYNKFFEELAESVNSLTAYTAANPGAKLLTEYDYIYEGNVEQWIKLANTLRLRLAMRIAFVDPVLAQTQAEAAVSHSSGLIESKADVAYLRRNGAFNYIHPLQTIAYTFNGGETRMGATMDCLLNGWNDPRAGVYFKEAVKIDKTTSQNTGSTSATGGTVSRPNSAMKFCGVRIGMTTGVTWDIFKGDNISNLNMDLNTPIVWMRAAESFFLRAEGALRGWNMGGPTDQAFYENGIRMSFEENGLSKNQADAYLTGFNFPANYVDNTTSSTVRNWTYTNGTNVTIGVGRVGWLPNASNDVKLEKIITQKWLANYPNGPESWAEFRRTGYPRVAPVVTNNSGGSVNTNIQVRRLPYPQSEYNLNKANVEIGVSKLQGNDNGGTRLWWDVETKTIP